jgi:hypothetical protein
MDLDDTLHLLGVDPSQLEPAPPWQPGSSWSPGIRERTGPSAKPCVGCGAPAQSTQIIDVPGHGHRWLDRCMPCLLATVKHDAGPPAPLEETLAVLRDAAREAGVHLTVITDPAPETTKKPAAP